MENKDSAVKNTNIATPHPSVDPEEYLHELAQDQHGHLVASRYTDWRYSDAAKKARTEKWLRLIANRPPFGHEGFDDSVHKPRPGFKPPLLYFGFAFKTEQVIAYTERWKIPLRDGLTWAEASGPKYTDRARGSILCGMMLMMCGHLGELCGTSFELVEPFNIEYLAMVQIYSNYNMGDRQCKDPQDEVEAIKIISEELACDGYKSEAGWWHSM